MGRKKSVLQKLLKIMEESFGATFWTKQIFFRPQLQLSPVIPSQFTPSAAWPFSSPSQSSESHDTLRGLPKWSVYNSYFYFKKISQQITKNTYGTCVLRQLQCNLPQIEGTGVKEITSDVQNVTERRDVFTIRCSRRLHISPKVSFLCFFFAF